MKKILIIIKICCILFVSDCLAFNLEDAFFSKKRCNFERRKSCELSNTNLSGLVLKYASTWGINL